MRTNTEVKPTSVEEGERMVLPLLPDERDTANGIVDVYMNHLSVNCGGRFGLIPSILDGFIRDIICGKDARYLNWDGERLGFTDECDLAIKDDIHYDHEGPDGVYFDACYYLEDCLSDIAISLLGHHAYRAAHNALNVLVAFHRLFEWMRAAIEEE